ncbi:MAG: MBL fold metallo-hydrolase [Candidatus Promineifilaceae bacterium]
MHFRRSIQPGLLGLICVIWLLVSCEGTAGTLSPTVKTGSQEETTSANQETVEVTMAPAAVTPITITIVYDNIAYQPELVTNWGFAAVVTYGDQSLLFDTGGDGPTLLSNMAALQIDPKTIEHVILSHEHDDHIGGLQGLLATGIHPTVHLLHYFPGSFKQQVASQTNLVETTAGAQVMEGVFVTGEVPGGLPEQATRS